MFVEVSIVLALLGLFWAEGHRLLLACGADDDWVAAPAGLCGVGPVARSQLALTTLVFAGGAFLLQLLWRHQRGAFGKGLS